jgi:hypothetical protein
MPKGVEHTSQGPTFYVVSTPRLPRAAPLLFGPMSGEFHRYTAARLASSESRSTSFAAWFRELKCDARLMRVQHD